MEVICLEEKAFFTLFDRVVQHLKEREGIKKDKWISADETMQLLRIKSKTTLQRFRDEGRVRFMHHDKKIILYDSDSIMEYLDKHSKNPI